MRHWHRDAPEWLHALISVGDVDSGSPSLRWLSESESAAERESLLSTWEEESYGEAFLRACQERAARSVPVAQGPTRTPRLTDVEQPLLVLWDPERPDGLWASLALSLPPVMWIPAGSTRAQLSAALAPYLVERFLSVPEFPRVVRGFQGTAEMLEIEGLEDIENHVVLSGPWVDGPMWGSAYDDDPWPPKMGPVPHVSQVVALREHMRQDEGRVPSTSFRTLWSRSILTFEQHPFDAFVAQARYVPSSHPEVIRDVNANFGMELPEDAPVDVAASLVFSGFGQTSTFEKMLAEPGGEEPLALVAIAAVAPGELSTITALRSVMNRKGYRDAVLQVADAYGFETLLHEILATTKEKKQRAELEAILAPGDEEVDA